MARPPCQCSHRRVWVLGLGALALATWWALHAGQAATARSPASPAPLESSRAVARPPRRPEGDDSGGEGREDIPLVVPRGSACDPPAALQSRVAALTDQVQAGARRELAASAELGRLRTRLEALEAKHAEALLRLQQCEQDRQSLPDEGSSRAAATGGDEGGRSAEGPDDGGSAAEPTAATGGTAHAHPNTPLARDAQPAVPDVPALQGTGVASEPEQPIPSPHPDSHPLLRGVDPVVLAHVPAAVGTFSILGDPADCTDGRWRWCFLPGMVDVVREALKHESVGMREMPAAEALQRQAHSSQGGAHLIWALADEVAAHAAYYYGSLQPYQRVRSWLPPHR